ncbi:MAG: hypothetical protein WCH11_08115 [Bdellovibrio sp.]
MKTASQTGSPARAKANRKEPPTEPAKVNNQGPQKVGGKSVELSGLEPSPSKPTSKRRGKNTNKMKSQRVPPKGAIKSDKNEKNDAPSKGGPKTKVTEYTKTMETLESTTETSSTDGSELINATESSVSLVPSASNEDEIYLTDAEGRRLCRVRDCDQAANVDAYCRFHYLLLWKKIQVRKKIIEDGKLSKYVEDLTSRYPDKFLEMIRKDLRSEKDFLAAIAELEIDESGLENEFEDEIQNDLEEVRGVASESGSNLSDEDVY